MKLKEMRLQSGIQQKELAMMIGVDEPTISRFENGKFLPTPKSLLLILEALDCRISDIYSKEEITFKEAKKTVPEEKKQKDCYKVTVRMPAGQKEDLQVALKGCGYSSITQWFTRCTEALLAEYEALQKQKETSPENLQTTDEVIVKNIGKVSSPVLYHKNVVESRGEVKKI